MRKKHKTALRMSFRGKAEKSFFEHDKLNFFGD